GSRSGHEPNRRLVRPGRLPPPPVGQNVSSASSVPQALEQALSQDNELFAGGEADFLFENIVLPEGDLLEQATVDGNQHPEGGLAIFINERNQFIASAIVFTGAICNRAKQHA